MRPEPAWFLPLLLLTGQLLAVEATADPTVTFTAKQLTLHYRSAMRNGAWISDTAVLGLSLTCTAVAEHTVLAISDCRILTAEGEIPGHEPQDLRLPAAPHVWDGVRWWAEEQGLTGPRTTLTAGLSLDLRPPAAAAKRVRITGSVRVRVATTAERQLDIPGSAGRTAVGADWLDPQAHAWSSPAIRCSEGLASRLVRLELRGGDTAAKATLRGFGTPGQSDGEGMSSTLSRALLPADVVHLTIVDGVADFEVPFTIGPVSLGVLQHD